MTTLSDFLKLHKAQDKQFTHTRIGDKTANIYGGSYFISKEDEPLFYELYAQHIDMLHPEYLTEKQLPDGVLAIDLDFRYLHEVQQKQHDQTFVNQLVVCLLECLPTFYSFDKETAFKVFIMEKDEVNRLTDKTITKDGIHIIFGIKVPSSIRKQLRQEMMKATEELLKTLPLINSIDDVFDEGVFMGSTNWCLFGSRKPNHKAYELTKCFRVGFDPKDGEFTMFEDEATQDELYVRNNERPSFELKSFENYEQEKPKEKSKQIIKVSNTSFEEIAEHGANIDLKYFGKNHYHDWTKILWSLKSFSPDLKEFARE
jgi:hypothetical protein